jgi:hypothetical protein
MQLSENGLDGKQTAIALTGLIHATRQEIRQPYEPDYERIEG